MVFVLHSKAYDALAAVDVIAPDGDAVDAGNAGEEAGECGFFSVVFYGECFCLCESSL